jgi:predicted outer membrane repeat protein
VVHTTTFSENSALTGGAIFNSDTASFSLFDSTFSANTADASAVGGGIRNLGVLTLSASTLTGNSAGESGGGIHNGGSGNLTVSNSTFSGNSTGASGGGIFNGGTAVLTVINSTLSGNTADTSGGGIFNSATFNYSNTIIADSVSGGDCASTGSIVTNTNNLVEDGSCAASLAADPKLGTLGNYGGKTEAFPILWDSPALDAGSNPVCAASPVNNLDQREEPRPFDGNHDGAPTCDIGSFETKEPTLTVITSDVPSPSIPDQLVTVTVTVQGLSLPTGNVKITGADENCTLSLAPEGTIPFLAIGSCQVRFTSGGNKVLTASYDGDATHAKSLGTDTHTVWFVMKFLSQAGNDGWVRESSETSNVGGFKNDTATDLRVGDDALDRQYKSILSFNTAGLPNTAIIQRVQVFVKRKSVTGQNPFGTHGGLRVGLRRPYFGVARVLGLDDFAAPANMNSVATMRTTALPRWYRGTFRTNSFAFINKTGSTQLRLFFVTGDNDDSGSDVLKLFSGNAISADRPYLLVYYMP